MIVALPLRTYSPYEPVPRIRLLRITTPLARTSTEPLISNPSITVFAVVTTNDPLGFNTTPAGTPALPAPGKPRRRRGRRRRSDVGVGVGVGVGVRPSGSASE